VEGVLTIGLAIIFAFLLPNSNKKILGMSEIECEWVQWNLASDVGQEDNSNEVSALGGFKMALLDLKTWMLMGILYSVSSRIRRHNSISHKLIQKLIQFLIRRTLLELLSTSSHQWLAVSATIATRHIY
jgi:hypothetical protein